MARFSRGFRKIVEESATLASSVKEAWRVAWRRSVEAFQIGVDLVVVGGWWIFVKTRLIIDRKLVVLVVKVSALEFLMVLAESDLGRRTVALLASMHARIDDEIVAGSPLAWIDGKFHTVLSHLVVENQYVMGFSVTSVILSVLMCWHHHRTTHRLAHLSAFVSSMRQMTGRSTEFGREPEVEKTGAILDALQILVESTTILKSGKAEGKKIKIFRRAFLLELKRGAQLFTIYAQWPTGSACHLEDYELKRNGASARALRPPDGVIGPDKGIVYVPWTRFPHGTRHWTDETRIPNYCQLDYEPRLFERGQNGVPAAASLICMEVPVKDLSGESKFVLRLDSTRAMCFDEGDYQAARLIANEISNLLTKG
jgi:hypothetical protein